MKHGSQFNMLTQDQFMRLLDITMRMAKEDGYADQMRIEDQELLVQVHSWFDPTDEQTMMTCIQSFYEEMASIRQNSLTVDDLTNDDITEVFRPSEFNGYSRTLTIHKVMRIKELIGDDAFGAQLRERGRRLDLMPTGGSCTCEKCGKQTDSLVSKEVLVSVTEGSSNTFGSHSSSFRTSRNEHKKVMNVCKECAGGCLIVLVVLGLGISAVSIGLARILFA